MENKTTSTDIEESKGKENRWKCSNCSQIFTDKQYELEDDDRCPLCKFPFSQMPYNPPHGIADKTLVKDSAPHLSNKSELKKEGVREFVEMVLSLTPRYLKGGTQVNQYFAKGWNEFREEIKRLSSNERGEE